MKHLKWQERAKSYLQGCRSTPVDKETRKITSSDKKLKVPIVFLTIHTKMTPCTEIYLGYLGGSV